MKPWFKSLRHFISARRAYLQSVPIRVDPEANFNNIWYHSYSSKMRFRPSQLGRKWVCLTFVGVYRYKGGSLKWFGIRCLFSLFVIGKSNLRGVNCTFGVFGGHNHCFTELNKFPMNTNGCLINHSIFVINVRHLVTFFVGSNEFPFEINKLLLRFSGHMHVGRRSISYFL